MRWVILETPYDDHQIPEDQFRLKGYLSLQERYKKDLSEITYDPDAIRNYMRAYIWDDKTGEEEDIEGFSWFTPEDSEQRLD